MNECIYDTIFVSYHRRERSRRISAVISPSRFTPIMLRCAFIYRRMNRKRPVVNCCCWLSQNSTYSIIVECSRTRKQSGILYIKQYPSITAEWRIALMLPSSSKETRSLGLLISVSAIKTSRAISVTHYSTSFQLESDWAKSWFVCFISRI